MGDFIMPKHTGLVREFTVPLKVCYEVRNENEGWIPNGHATRKEDGFTYSIFQEYKKLGYETEPKTDNSDYTKDAQIPLYLGFMEGRGRNNAEKRITSQGIKMHEAIEAEDLNTQYELLIDAFERKTFGRNNQGFPSADSDVEVPNVLLLSSIFLDGVTRQEFYYIIFMMHTRGWDLARAVADIIYLRKTDNAIPNVPTIYTDCKLIPLFVSFNFLVEDDQKRLHIEGNVYNSFAKRILCLRTRNQKQQDSVINQFTESEELKNIQKIYYGCPGTGKSFNINGDLAKVYPNEGERKEYVYRTTFHPDTDYASFVGCYKPRTIILKKIRRIDYSIDELADLIKNKYANAENKVLALHSFALENVDYFNGVIAKYSKKEFLQKADLTEDFSAEINKMVNLYSWMEDNGYFNINNTITYQFIPQVFTNAYIKAWKEIGKDNPKPVYLVIEEINRGNCAQIFGDLFQLLDRDKKTGISEYSIKADNDLADYLEKALGVGHEGIKNRELRLPPNLIIYATMNTSDQSLFPMDSAFKRRWDWKYVPIDYKKGDSAAYTITIDDETYKWVEFLKVVNNEIRNLTHSEDKQMGNYFIKKSVSQDEFINKVMFYLWDEVCKDEYNTERNFLRYKEGDVVKEFSFTDLFGEDKTKILKGFITKLKEDNLNKNKEE